MDRLNLIQQQCSLVTNPCESQGREQVKTALDVIVNELNNNKTSRDPIIFQQIVTTISDRSNSDKVFSKENLFDHPIFTILRDYFYDLFCQWENDQLRDEPTERVFIQIAALFADLSYHATDGDANTLKTLIIHEPVINELCKCLKDISTTGKYLKDKRIEALNHIIRAIHFLEKARAEIQSIPMMHSVTEGLVSCVCSTYFIDMFKTIVDYEKFDECQTFLLDTCTNTISWHDAGIYNQTHITVRTALLNMFVIWFENYLSSFKKLTKLTIKVIGQLCITLIGGNSNEDDVFPQQIRDDYCKLIDEILTILTSIDEKEAIDDVIIFLIQFLTQSLYSLTMTIDLRSYIKSKKSVPLLLKLANMEDETIQFNIYRILAVILTEDDIKTLKNANKIAGVMLRFFNNLIDDASMKPRFQNLLRSLKILIQHDQIKEELTNQGILPLLLRCEREPKFDPIKVRLPALEILLALTFDANAAQQLKKDSDFIKKLRTSANSLTDKYLKRVVENLVWKLDKEEAAITNSSAESDTNTSAKLYDVMLSYSHSDRELCYRIYDRLVRDQMRVWIDRDQMHGQTMVAMANAIENAEFVFICMSDLYKQSAYCQSEAHYAFQCRCHIIPLIMKKGYRPDGWLGILTSGKIYIDFPKLGFDAAYERLKTEMTLETNSFNKSNNNSMQTAKSVQALTSSPLRVVQTVISNIGKTTEGNYPKLVNNWTNDHVRSFLINENLAILLPVLGEMNGRHLYETYKQCKAHWDFMFQTFKAEVAAINPDQLLTIYIYIRFLDEIENYVPVKSIDNSTNAPQKSATCTLV